MATAYLETDDIPVILPKHFSQAAAIMAQFDRDRIASTVEVLVSLLDVMDDDPDLEEDDPSGQCDEDDHNTNLHLRSNGEPGCLISDAGIADSGGLSEAHDCDGPHPMRGGGSGDY